MAEASFGLGMATKEGVLPEVSRQQYLYSLQRLMEFQDSLPENTGLLGVVKKIAYPKSAGVITWHDTLTLLSGVGGYLSNVIRTNGTVEALRSFDDKVVYRHVIRTPKGSGEMGIELQLQNLGDQKTKYGTTRADFGNVISVFQDNEKPLGRKPTTFFSSPKNGFQVAIPVSLPENLPTYTLFRTGSNGVTREDGYFPNRDTLNPLVQNKYIKFVSSVVDAVIANAPVVDRLAAQKLDPGDKPFSTFLSFPADR